MRSISVHVDDVLNLPPAGEVEVRVLGGGRPHATNTSTNPQNMVPRSSRVNVEPGSVSYTFEPHSYTSLRFGAAR